MAHLQNIDDAIPLVAFMDAGQNESVEVIEMVLLELCCLSETCHIPMSKITSEHTTRSEEPLRSRLLI